MACSDLRGNGAAVLPARGDDVLQVEHIRRLRLILVDGSAAWCHWCHVMDETTYRDPAVGQILHARFVVVRFDVDERPDLGDRYESTGWPATILISPDGDELGRYRGFLDAERLRTILEATVQSFDRGDRGAAAAAGVVHELEEAQVERQALLREPPVRA